MAEDEVVNRNALEIHSHYKGKVGISTKVPIRNLSDFHYLYTPGVAEPSRRIAADKESAYDFTNKGNSIAIVTDGSRVLGLGNIGPLAALPVMEGKALLFKYLGGVDAYPLCVDAKTSDELVDIVRRISPSVGGINLEDIESPKCFEVYDAVRDSLGIPILHDDQHGTATVVLAGLLNSLEVVGKKLSEVKIAVVGAGAAGLACTKLLLKAGAQGKNLIVCDSKGILHDGRDHMDRHKSEVAKVTNMERLQGSVQEALVGADVMIGLSKPGPWIPGQWIEKMASDSVVFALANPTPEIWPKDAVRAGVKVVATGRSDFPNQINNSLAFPSLFRGALEVRARSISDGMLMAAAHAIANSVRSTLGLKCIVPTMEQSQVFVETALAVSKAAIAEGIAVERRSESGLMESIQRKIHHERLVIDVLERVGLLQT